MSDEAYARHLAFEVERLEAEVEKLRADAARYRGGRAALIGAAIRLSAPLGWATDGTVESAIRLIEGYVEKLENDVDVLQKRTVCEMCSVNVEMMDGVADSWDVTIHQMSKLEERLAKVGDALRLIDEDPFSPATQERAVQKIRRAVRSRG